ncbi:hypothetical protein SDC9_123741 [bioreactor metagenome]|uniref:Uncharacterized protein n=1 Tax=bioreactor metagenome TaxID=1076179 RepID=A0A645CIY9_9ZZZZ
MEKMIFHYPAGLKNFRGHGQKRDDKRQQGNDKRLPSHDRHHQKLFDMAYQSIHLAVQREGNEKYPYPQQRGDHKLQQVSFIKRSRLQIAYHHVPIKILL